MRNLNEMEYLLKLIDGRIKAKTRNLNSPIAKVAKTDGIFADCDLVYAIEGITQLKNVPIVQSGRFHYSVKVGDFGLLLNTGLIPSEFFTSETIKVQPIEANFYVFLPLQTKLSGAQNQLKADNVVIEDSEKTNSLKFDQDVGVTFSSVKDLNIQSKNSSFKAEESFKAEVKTMEIKASEESGVDINESKLGSTLKALSKDLKDLKSQVASISLTPAPIPGKTGAAISSPQGPCTGSIAIVWNPSSLSDLEAIAKKIK